MVMPNVCSRVIKYSPLFLVHLNDPEDAVVVRIECLLTLKPVVSWQTNIHL